MTVAAEEAQRLTDERGTALRKDTAQDGQQPAPLTQKQMRELEDNVRQEDQRKTGNPKHH